MLAKLQEEIPRGPLWVYEPKWDGFRGIVYRTAAGVTIGSRDLKPLERYFPEVVEAVAEAVPEPAVLDGEIIIAGERGLDFDALLQRIHPAASRIRRLSAETPARLIAFDLLSIGEEDLRAAPYRERRRRLEALLARSRRRPSGVPANPDSWAGGVFLTPQTSDPDEAASWFERYEGAGCDGIIAKTEDLPYVAGERVMVKVKHRRTVDCVVGGYRIHKHGGLGALLLGLYRDGVLHYVGHTSSFNAAEKRQVEAMLKPLEGGESFGHGRSPGGPSRWSQGRETDWVQVRPELVCEVSFDYLQGDRFRHAARFHRWRPDRVPESCRWEQLVPPNPFSLEEILGAPS
jgi:ATP-dependent DNA ligase